MEKLTLEQVKTLVWVAVLNEFEYEGLPLGEKIAKFDYTALDMKMEEYVVCLEYLCKIGVFKPVQEDEPTVTLESPFYDGPEDEIPCYELTKKGKFVTAAVLKITGKKKDETMKCIINGTIVIGNFVKEHWTDIINIVAENLK